MYIGCSASRKLALGATLPLLSLNERHACARAGPARCYTSEGAVVDDGTI